MYSRKLAQMTLYVSACVALASAQVEFPCDRRRGEMKERLRESRKRSCWLEAGTTESKTLTPPRERGKEEDGEREREKKQLERWEEEHDREKPVPKPREEYRRRFCVCVRLLVSSTMLCNTGPGRHWQLELMLPILLNDDVDERSSAAARPKLLYNRSVSLPVCFPTPAQNTHE